MGALNTEPPPAGSAPPTTPPPPSPLGDEPSVSPREFLIACVIMLAFTTIFVAARVAATLHRQRVGIADGKFGKRHRFVDPISSQRP